MIWTLLTSFKPESKIFSTQIKLIDDPTLKNYTDLLTRGDFVQWAFNSLFVSILTTIFAVFLVGYLRLRDLAVPFPWPERGACTCSSSPRCSRA